MTGVSGGDVSTLAHEIGEAINDPPGTNPTPVWGNIGQVLGGCQNNFEVGDPLSPGFGTPTNEFVVAGGVIPQYHLQELAFYSWFYGSNALGTGAEESFLTTAPLMEMRLSARPAGTNRDLQLDLAAKQRVTRELKGAVNVKKRNSLAKLSGSALLLSLSIGSAEAGTLSLWDGTGANDTTSWAARW